MPLINSSSAKAVIANVRELVKSGYKPKQAYAIAKSKQQEAKKHK